MPSPSVSTPLMKIVAWITSLCFLCSKTKSMRRMDKKGKLPLHDQKGIGTQWLNFLFLTCSSIRLYKIEPMSFLFQFFVCCCSVAVSHQRCRVNSISTRTIWQRGEMLVQNCKILKNKLCIVMTVFVRAQN